jgi:hypothetical protein
MQETLEYEWRYNLVHFYQFRVSTIGLDRGVVYALATTKALSGHRNASSVQPNFCILLQSASTSWNDRNASRSFEQTTELQHLEKCLF